jgi:vaccinia related kinase
MASKGKVAVKKAVKKKNGYEMPKSAKPGIVLIDNHKKNWKIGKSIGVGGFGEIYSACDASAPIKNIEDYPFVVKLVSFK